MSALRLSLRAGLLVGALSFLAAWLTWLAYSSWQFRQSLNPASLQAPSVAPPTPRAQPDPQAIARLFGVPIEEIQALCGHEDKTTTEIYVKQRWRETVQANQVAI